MEQLILANKIEKDDELYLYSNPKTAQKMAYNYLGKTAILYKSTNPKKKYSNEKKPPKEPVSFRLDLELFEQVKSISYGNMTEWYVDAVAEKLERDRVINEAINNKINGVK